MTDAHTDYDFTQREVSMSISAPAGGTGRRAAQDRRVLAALDKAISASPEMAGMLAQSMRAARLREAAGFRMNASGQWLPPSYITTRPA